MKTKTPWYDILQYSALLLMAAAMPHNWRFGVWVALLLVLVSTVKIAASRRIGNPALGASLQWVLAAPALYWAVIAISMLWTADLATGVQVLHLKASLLVFPFCFLLTDTSYLTPRRLRGLGYALLLSVCAALLYFLVLAVVNMVQGLSFTEFKNTVFFSHEKNGFRHHAYIALYAVTVLVFVYTELVCYWHQLKRWHRGMLLTAAAMATGYVVLVNSRAGMLAMGFTQAACLVHLAVTHRNWKLVAGTALMLTVCIAAAMQLTGYTDRINETVTNVEGDVRFQIYTDNWNAYRRQPLLGYGAGDYHAVQIQQYQAEHFDSGTAAEYNAHNQYLETLMAAGLPGLAALLFFLLAPLAVALRQRSRYRFQVALLTAIVAFNLLFESMFERQMGLLFIGSLYAYMALILSGEENKFVRTAKS